MTHDVENIMIILSSPSGVGKTTLTKKIQQKYINPLKFQFLIQLELPDQMRSMELIIFLFPKKFEKLIKEKKFYEYAEIFSNYYGTLKKHVDENILKNDLIFDIDWQGTKQLSEFKNLNLIKIYLITENKEELKKRLIKKKSKHTVRNGKKI